VNRHKFHESLLNLAVLCFLVAAVALYVLAVVTRP
jgi:hypothetical protein